MTHAFEAAPATGINCQIVNGNSTFSIVPDDEEKYNISRGVSQPCEICKYVLFFVLHTRQVRAKHEQNQNDSMQANVDVGAGNDFGTYCDEFPIELSLCTCVRRWCERRTETQTFAAENDINSIESSDIQHHSRPRTRVQPTAVASITAD